MKIVNTPEDILIKANKGNGDVEFVENLHKEHHNTTLAELDSHHTPQWCPGCGNFGILLSIKKAIVNLKLDPKDVVIVSGIGCSGKEPHYLKTYGIETIHGRALPVATGTKLANKNLHVIVVGGDGDGYGIGMGHFIHAMRRNINLTYIVHNNEIYGLTKGQTSPTSPKGTKSVSTPNGAIEEPVNPLVLGLGSGATFIARGFAGDVNHLADLISKGIEHKGFAIIDTLQPCVSYNPNFSYNYIKERVMKIEEQENYNPKDKHIAYNFATINQEDKIPIGIFYQSEEDRETYIDDLPEDKEGPLVLHDISNINIDDLLDNYE
jgi:2-oxoglutarate ferredoxin oxidoreductase subunit beta